MTNTIASLVSDVARLLRRRFDERARGIGITRAQWRVLTLLMRHEGKTQGALAELLEVEPITLCRMIDRLEEAGHVERRPNPRDRRAWNLYLTARARPLLDQLQVIAGEVTERGMAGLDAAARERLTADLAIIRDNLAQPAPATAAHG